MDYSATLAHLSAARRHVGTREQNIARQRKAVAELERGGYVSLGAKPLFVHLGQLQSCSPT
jgi:hypothetical protein